MGEFENVKRNFGFGCMRLLMNGDEVDFAEFCKMVDYFLAQGFNYFDTAHGYLSGKSETAIRECLVKRRPRESYILTDKLTGPYFDKEEDIRPFFQSQLEACGVEYFDFYLMHSQCKDVFEKFKSCRAYETAFELKAEGRVKHVGISFHDTAEVLDEILTEYPQTEVVQLQLNYVDLDDPEVQARKCYEVCRRHGKPVIVMEPVKGGNLVNLPDEAKEIIYSLGGGSPASYAIRFAAGFDGVFMVLSGMSDMKQMEDNVSHMKEFKPLDGREREALDRVREIFLSKHLIPCTACRYCTDGCPKHIAIPDLFACMNAKRVCHDWNAEHNYEDICAKQGCKASDCIQCGKCEQSCPQHLHIRDLLKEVAKEFENK